MGATEAAAKRKAAWDNYYRDIRAAEHSLTATVEDEAIRRLNAIRDRHKTIRNAEQKLADERKKLEEGLEAFIEKGRRQTLDHAIAKIRKDTEDAVTKMKDAADEMAGPMTPEQDRLHQRNLNKKEGELRGSGNAQGKTATDDAVKNRLSAMKQELTTLAQIQGGLFRQNYDEVFNRMAAAAGLNAEVFGRLATAAGASAKEFYEIATAGLDAEDWR